MANSDSETTSLLHLDTSATGEEELNDSRETETTDDEFQEDAEQSNQIWNQPGCSYRYSSNNLATDTERPSHSYEHEITDDESEASTDTVILQVGKGTEAVSYFADGAVTSSSDSNKAGSIENSDDLGCVVEYTCDEKGNVDYVDIDFDDTISEKHVAKLMNKLRLNHYTAVSCEGDFTISKCRGLFERDYYCEVIDNFNGNLSRHYPARIIIPVARKCRTDSTERLDAPDFDLKLYCERVKNSVFSRLLTRFVVPVILFDKKFICRSGSLTVRKTAAYESARQKGVPKDHEMDASLLHQIKRKFSNTLALVTSRTLSAASQLFFPKSMKKLRDVDAEIMRNLDIEHVCDLMLEDRKKFIHAVRISSSEKINKDIFKDSSIEQMPYPGCKFFRKYHDANRSGYKLYFDWKRPEINVVMKFSGDPYEIFPDVDWVKYKEWDIINLTENYMKMMLFFLAKDEGGMLVHCISGWDRTPLFISLLRLSLWADGLIHESLSYRDITYLTLAYDWYLFGHNLPRRLSEKQEIMHFCFYFLYYIASDEFSVTRLYQELPEDEKASRNFPKFEPGRRQIIRHVHTYAMGIYEEYITKMD